MNLSCSIFLSLLFIQIYGICDKCENNQFCNIETNECKNCGKCFDDYKNKINKLEGDFYNYFRNNLEIHENILTKFDVTNGDVSKYENKIKTFKKQINSESLRNKDLNNKFKELNINLDELGGENILNYDSYKKILNEKINSDYKIEDVTNIKSELSKLYETLDVVIPSGSSADLLSLPISTESEIQIVGNILNHIINDADTSLDKIVQEQFTEILQLVPKIIDGYLINKEDFIKLKLESEKLSEQINSFLKKEKELIELNDLLTDILLLNAELESLNKKIEDFSLDKYYEKKLIEEYTRHNKKMEVVRKKFEDKNSDFRKLLDKLNGFNRTTPNSLDLDDISANLASSIKELEEKTKAQ